MSMIKTEVFLKTYKLIEDGIEYVITDYYKELFKQGFITEEEYFLELV